MRAHINKLSKNRVLAIYLPSCARNEKKWYKSIEFYVGYISIIISIKCAQLFNCYLPARGHVNKHIFRIKFKLRYLTLNTHKRRRFTYINVVIDYVCGYFSIACPEFLILFLFALENVYLFIPTIFFGAAAYPCCWSSTNADFPGIVVAPPSKYLGVCGASGASIPECGVPGGPS